MKIKFAILVFLPLFFSETYAQQKNALSISVGPSIPLGDFANSNIYETHAGAAKTGFSANVAFSHAIRKNWGYAFALMHHENEFDTQSMYSGYGGVGEWEAKSYSGYALYGGGFYSMDLFKRFTIEGTGLIGAASHYFPEIHSDFGLGNSLMITSPGAVTSFAYMIRLAFRYHVGERVAILLSTDFCNAKPVFSVTTILRGDSSVEQESSLELPMTVLNVGVGFTYRF